MAKIIRILGIVAVIQILLVAVSNMGEPSLSAQSSSKKLLDFELKQIDSLVIKTRDKQIQLNKKNGRWQTSDSFPADQSKVTDLLNKLNDLKHGLPVTTTKAALKRFKVDKEDFERLIILKQADTQLASLYLGSGAGARQTHVRSDKDTAIYTVELAAYYAPVEVSDWQDKTILQVKKENVTGITLTNLTLERDDNANKNDSMIFWKALNLPVGKIINQKEVNDDLSKLLSIRFEKILGKQSNAEFGLEKPVMSLTLKQKKGTRQYQFGKHKEQDNYVLKVSDREEYFQIPAYTVKPLLENMTQNKWLMDKPVSEKEQEESGETKAEKQSTQ